MVVVYSLDRVLLIRFGQADGFEAEVSGPQGFVAGLVVGSCGGGLSLKGLDVGCHMEPSVLRDGWRWFHRWGGTAATSAVDRRDGWETIIVCSVFDAA